MCTAVKEMREESEAKGKNEARVEVAKNLLKDGTLSVEKIATMSMLPLSKVKELEKEMFPLQ